ncbi:MAG: HAMP domain-containing sensor histidine kinase [Candidatus Saccharibacteria bacterium]
MSFPSFSTDLFHSARLKLTGFYFAVLLAFCLLLTFGVHAFTDHELSRGDDAQRTIAHRIFQDYSEQGMPYSGPDNAPNGDRYFANGVADQADLTRQHLNRDYVLVDVALLAIGAVLSYWYAGRTLHPIEQAHEQQKRFTSDASHELRTPLASMRLENEVFLRQKNFSEKEAREQIASNLEEVERLEKLATNLLALSQYEQGTAAHATTVVGELVGDAIERAKHNKGASKVRFTQAVTPATIDVNRESLVELLSILLDNAIKYGPKNGEIEIGGRLEDQKYILTVRDHGHGISDEDLPHIFERMYRGDKARSSKVSGHGIGLSLARQIAQANDAILEAGNAAGGGAIFTLTLQ